MKKPLLTSAAKASFWDWVGDAAFGAVIGLCGAFVAAYGQRGWKNALNAAGEGFRSGNLIGGIGTVVVGPAIFLYLGHRAARFPFLPSPVRERHRAPPAPELEADPGLGWADDDDFKLEPEALSSPHPSDSP